MRSALLIVLAGCALTPTTTGAACPQSIFEIEGSRYASSAAVRETTTVANCITRRGSYDLVEGLLSAEADQPCPWSTVLGVLAADAYRVVGPVSGTSFTVQALLRIRGTGAGFPAESNDSYGSISASLTSGSQTTSASATNDSLDRLLVLDLQVESGVAFPLESRLEASSSAGTARIDGQLGFRGLPPGNHVESCHGYQGMQVGVWPFPLPAFRLHSSTPHPVRGSGWMSFELPRSEPATLELLDAAGRMVRVLFDGPGSTGPQSVRFETRGLAAGVYLLRLRAGSQVAQRKLVLIP